MLKQHSAVVYAVISFDTKNKRLCMVVRATEQDAKEQIENEVSFLKSRENVIESKLDYPPSERELLGVNEHNGYVKTEYAEFFWKTECVVM